jgi:YD repeat-containing protein
MTRTRHRIRGALLAAAAGVGAGWLLAPQGARAQTVTTGYSWHATLPLPTQIVEAGLTTDLTYDDAGRLLGLTQTDTTSQSDPYPTAGRKRVWAYAYGIGNRVTAVDGPLPGPDDTVTSTYTAEGLLQTVTDPVGLTTTVTAWNSRGQPTSVTDPNGVATTYAYDGLGRVTGIVLDPGVGAQSWAMTYTPVGDLETLKEPTGRTLTFSWDGARRLIGVANNLGERSD